MMRPHAPPACHSVMHGHGAKPWLFQPMLQRRGYLPMRMAAPGAIPAHGSKSAAVLPHEHAHVCSGPACACMRAQAGQRAQALVPKCAALHAHACVHAGQCITALVPERMPHCMPMHAALQDNALVRWCPRVRPCLCMHARACRAFALGYALRAGALAPSQASFTGVGMRACIREGCENACARVHAGQCAGALVPERAALRARGARGGRGALRAGVRLRRALLLRLRRPGALALHLRHVRAPPRAFGGFLNSSPLLGSLVLCMRLRSCRP